MIFTVTYKENFIRLRAGYGLFLLFGGSEEDDEAEQTGGGDLFAVPLWRKRGRHEDGDEVLLHPVLLEVLESYCLYFLWSRS
ncbi:hypothetical protein RHGRI_009600 [Rhododendron griersonianum]|uniref:Uncharacterized protein n=1 Tax=Rhododendron griersonianum TaxID=479676 RepID=A0AAV6KFX6_9ERIC|nr:hypothetical protein RHGRI_009600 [Rhododendron griersonianum]